MDAASPRERLKTSRYIHGSTLQGAIDSIHLMPLPPPANFSVQDTPSVSERQLALNAVQQEIAACTLCVAAGFIPHAHPIFHGHAGQRLMVVGQAPGPTAAERPLPYSGASGKALQGWLARAGFTDGALHRDFYLTSITKCFPGPARHGGKGDRPPSAAEIARCAPHLDREIALVRPEIVLALGRLATERLDPTARRLPLAELVGTLRPAERAGHAFFVLPLPHPSGVSRWLNDPVNRARLDLALKTLGEKGESKTASRQERAYATSQELIADS
jgi:uracil-DNA glycosylase family 4